LALAGGLLILEAAAQSADETSLQAMRWSQRTTHDDRPRPPNLNGTSLAFSVAGEAYTFGGDHLRLPGELEGWEDDIALGVGVFRALGETGHIGAGLGVDDEEDVAVRAHMAMRW
jgi:hypothetical protein